MHAIETLLATLKDLPVVEVRVGAFWTVVVTHDAGRRRCGLAATLGDDDHHWGRGPAVPDAGRLTAYSALELASLVRSDRPMAAAIGMAAINALLPEHRDLWVNVNAGDVIAQRGQGKRVALVGHFPFVPHLKDQVRTLWVLEQRPRGEDLPATAAADVIPEADMLAITGTALINHTFDELMRLRRPDAVVLVLGPSTPLSPALFDYGVDLLSGAVVEDVDAVLQAVSQGANFRQLHRQGVRLVTMQKEEWSHVV